MCKEEIDLLPHKGLINPWESTYSGMTFYFYSKQDQGISRLVIHYEPFVKTPKWINYPITKLKKNGLIISKPGMIVFTNTNWLGSLNHISASYNLNNDKISLYDNKSVEWTNQYPIMIRKIKKNIHALPSAMIALPYWKKITEVKITNNGYEGVVKNVNPKTKKEYLVRFYSGKWKAQTDYTTRNMFSTVKYVLRFHTDQEIRNYISNQMITKWQDYSILFNLKVVYKQGKNNSLLNPCQKLYYLTSYFTGIILPRRMENMPSFANLVTIREIPKPTGNNPESASYANIVAMETSGMNHHTYHPNEKEEIIFFPIEPEESNTSPWNLIKDYNGSYPYGDYRNQIFYENILIKNGCYISHVNHKQSGGYAFSELIIKRVISLPEWGNNPNITRRLHYTDTGKEYSDRQMIEYDYLDYIEAFHKVLVYENSKHKHFWFITICPSNKEAKIPFWFIRWWKQFGPTKGALPTAFIPPEAFQEVFEGWITSSTLLQEYQNKDFRPEEIYSLLYFEKSAIPYIWRWEPVCGLIHILDTSVHCLKRRSYTKVWERTGLNPVSKRPYDYVMIHETSPIIIGTKKNDHDHQMNPQLIKEDYKIE